MTLTSSKELDFLKWPWPLCVTLTSVYDFDLFRRALISSNDLDFFVWPWPLPMTLTISNNFDLFKRLWPLKITFTSLYDLDLFLQVLPEWRIGCRKGFQTLSTLYEKLASTSGSWQETSWRQLSTSHTRPSSFPSDRRCWPWLPARWWVLAFFFQETVIWFTLAAAVEEKTPSP